MPKIFFALLAAALTLAGCNTMRGAGEDISTAGTALSDEAEDAEQ